MRQYGSGRCLGRFIIHIGQRGCNYSFAHVSYFSLTANCILSIHLGAKNKLITNPRDMKAYLAELRKEKFSFITGVNTLYNLMMNHPDFKPLILVG